MIKIPIIAETFTCNIYRFYKKDADIILHAKFSDQALLQLIYQFLKANDNFQKHFTIRDLIDFHLPEWCDHKDIPRMHFAEIDKSDEVVHMNRIVKALDNHIRYRLNLLVKNQSSICKLGESFYCLDQEFVAEFKATHDKNKNYIAYLTEHMCNEEGNSVKHTWFSQKRKLNTENPAEQNKILKTVPFLVQLQQWDNSGIYTNSSELTELELLTSSSKSLGTGNI